MTALMVPNSAGSDDPAEYRSSWRATARNLGLAALVLLLSLPVITRAAEEVPLATLVDAFVQIAERGELGDKRAGISKWNRPIKIAMVGQAQPDQIEAITKHVRALSERIGLAMTMIGPIASSAKPGEKPVPIDFQNPQHVFHLMHRLPQHDWTMYLMHGIGNDASVWRADLLILLADHISAAFMARLMQVQPSLAAEVAAGSSPCFVNFYVDLPSYEFKYAMVVLRTDIPDWARRRCIHEELTQILGLRNDIKGSEITLFDDMPMKRRTELTPYDWLFLEVLYDRRMTPGLAGAELRRKARELIAEKLASLQR